MSNKIGIYLITTPNNKKYVGQSWNIEKRFKRYLRLDCKSQIKLYNSFIKYGASNHIFTILEDISSINESNEIIQSKLNDLEHSHWLALTESFEMLNIREPKGSRGKLSIETRHKLSIINKGANNPMYGRVMGEEQRINVSKFHTGIKRSDETRKRISDSKMGKKRSEDVKRAISEGNKGKIVSEESRRKMSESRLKYFQNKKQLIA